MGYGYGRVWGRTNWAARKPLPTPKLMVAKFAGTCKTCGTHIPVGTEILYKSGFGATHVSTEACATAKASAPAAPPAVVIEASPVIAFLNVAKANGLKYPKVRFAAPGGGELRLSIAGPTAKVPGSVNVVVRGEWLGRINPDGAGNGRNLTGNATLLALLAKIASDPARLAKEYGALTGNCSFCSKALTDAGSVEVGYGPICAKNWNLPHKPKGTPVIETAVAA